MAQRRKEDRARKAELNRLDNEECGEEEEEEEEMTDESDEEEVTGLSNYFIHIFAFVPFSIFIISVLFFFFVLGCRRPVGRQ